MRRVPTARTGKESLMRSNGQVKFESVAFFGDAAIDEQHPVFRTAYIIAQKLARVGYSIVNGGGPGVMLASTQGAESVQGKTLSVTFYPEHATGFEGRYLSNQTDREIKTENYIERIFELVAKSDVLLLFKGGTGTLSELGLVWVLAKLYYGHHKPFILVGNFWRPIIGAIHENLLIDAKEMDVFKIVDGVDDVLPAIRHFEKVLNKIDHSHCKHCGESAFMS